MTVFARGAALACVVAAFAASPARAQRVFPGGIHPKHDDRIGPRLLRPEHAPTASDSAASAVALALFAGAWPTADGVALTVEAQRAVLRLLTASAGAAADEEVAAWVERLGAPDNREARPAARTLARRARGVLSTPARLNDALAAYNAFVDASAAAFLREPPPEFLAMRAVLARLADARRAEGRAR